MIYIFMLLFIFACNSIIPADSDRLRRGVRVFTLLNKKNNPNNSIRANGNGTNTQQNYHQQDYTANNRNDDCVDRQHDNLKQLANQTSSSLDKSIPSLDQSTQQLDESTSALDPLEKKRILQQKIRDIWQVKPTEHLVSRLDKSSSNKKPENGAAKFHTDSWITNYASDSNTQENYHQQDYAVTNRNNDCVSQQHDNSSNNPDGLDSRPKQIVSLQICKQLEKKSSVQGMENGRNIRKGNYQQNYPAHNGNDDCVSQQHDNSSNNRDRLDNSSRQSGRLPSLQEICRESATRMAMQTIKKYQNELGLKSSNESLEFVSKSTLSLKKQGV